MAYGQIDPARLDGDALTRWYLRSPADIEKARQDAAAQKYGDFFGDLDRFSDSLSGTESPAKSLETDGFEDSPAWTGSAFQQRPLSAQASPTVDGGGGSFDDVVYHPDSDGVQKFAAATPPWNCAGCHSLLPPLPAPVPVSAPLLPLFRDGPPSAGGSSRREWSDKPQCNQQFETDREICQRAKSYKCWENQNKRLAHCSPTGEVGIPKLGFGPRGR